MEMINNPDIDHENQSFNHPTCWLIIMYTSHEKKMGEEPLKETLIHH